MASRASKGTISKSTCAPALSAHVATSSALPTDVSAIHAANTTAAIDATKFTIASTAAALLEPP